MPVSVSVSAGIHKRAYSNVLFTILVLHTPARPKHQVKYKVEVGNSFIRVQEWHRRIGIAGTSVNHRKRVKESGKRGLDKGYASFFLVGDGGKRL